jgi:hypothetical protein
VSDQVTNVGEQYNISGMHNVGKIETNYGSADVNASLQSLMAAVQVLRGHLSATERQVIDESVETVKYGEKAEPGRLRRALSNIAGIAAVVGEVGAPVIEAVRKVTMGLGM